MILVRIRLELVKEFVLNISNENVIYTELHIFTFKALSCLDLTFAASKGVSCDTPPAALFHYHWLLARAGLEQGLVQGWPYPRGPGPAMFKPNGNYFFISSENLTEEWSVLWKYFVCEKKSIKLWLWVIIPNKDQYCMAWVWWTVRNIKIREFWV